MSTRKFFNDGSSIEWIDRETLQYLEGEFSVLVWVDFEPGFFSNGKIIKASSIIKWDTKPDECTELIDEIKKKEIIDKIQQYYKSFKKKCRVEY